MDSTRNNNHNKNNNNCYNQQRKAGMDQLMNYKEDETETEWMIVPQKDATRSRSSSNSHLQTKNNLTKNTKQTTKNRVLGASILPSSNITSTTDDSGCAGRSDFLFSSSDNHSSTSSISIDDIILSGINESAEDINHSGGGDIGRGLFSSIPLPKMNINLADSSDIIGELRNKVQVVSTNKTNKPSEIRQQQHLQTIESNYFNSSNNNNNNNSQLRKKNSSSSSSLASSIASDDYAFMNPTNPSTTTIANIATMNNNNDEPIITNIRQQISLSSAISVSQSSSKEAPSSSTASLKNNECQFMEHIVLPNDTLQGLTLQYKVSATRLRQVNHFSGSNLSLAPKKLHIPIKMMYLNLNNDAGIGCSRSYSNKGGSSDGIRIQDVTTEEYKLHKVMAECPSMAMKEVKA